jgi:hypothetical protein
MAFFAGKDDSNSAEAAAKKGFLFARVKREAPVCLCRVCRLNLTDLKAQRRKERGRRGVIQQHPRREKIEASRRNATKRERGKRKKK